MRNRFLLKHFEIPLLRMVRNFTIRRVIWGIIFFTATTLILGINMLPEKVDLEINQASPQTFEYKGPKQIVYVSEILTEKARSTAEQEVEPVYRVDKNVLESFSEKIVSYFNAVQEVKSQYEERDDLQQGTELLAEKLDIKVNDQVLKGLLEVPMESSGIVQQELINLIRLFMKDGIQKEALESIRQAMISEVDSLGLSPSYTAFCKAILLDAEIKPNLVYDPVSTNQKIEEARMSTEPVLVSVQPGEVIMRQGDIVRLEDIEKLQELGLLRSKSPFGVFAGLSLLVLAAYVILLLYLLNYKEKVFKDERRFILFGILVVATLSLARVVNSITISMDTQGINTLGFLIPMAAGSMMISILLDTGLAVFATALMAGFVGIITGNQLQFAMVGLMGGMAGIYSVSHLSQRGDLMKASLYIALANVVSILGFGLMQDISLTTLSIGMLFGLANGLLSAILTIGSLPFLESAFGITTSLKLLELSNPNQKLLKSMLLEAPGTYHHSILVGNLAEAAADAVGADSLLARVGAYYHDIGKLKRPYFFIENQFADENPHDRLAPSLSTLIITSHVKDGLDMAKEASLPPDIQDIIGQHHGSGLLSIFYRRALEDEKSGDSISETDFRYDCSKPHTKEAAIVMLADSVEAAVRSAQKQSPNRLETLVRKIIKDKMEDGQLQNCELTFKELDIIAETFLRVLNGIFHSRIEYPETVLKELERSKGRNAAIDSKSVG